MKREDAVLVTNLVYRLEDLELFREEFIQTFDNDEYAIDYLFDKIIDLIDEEIESIKSELEKL
jgi:hypothetical protein